MRFTTPNDSQFAQDMESRWRACSEEARHFATYNIWRFPLGTLPYVIAESYDKDRVATELRASEDRP